MTVGDTEAGLIDDASDDATTVSTAPRALDQVDCFIIAMEAKDRYCLDPVIPALTAACRSLTVIDEPTAKSISAAKLAPEVEALVAASCPLVVSASLNSLDYVELVRGDDDFISLGLEHGIAPFKDYTASARLLRHDVYLAPTDLWGERLVARGKPAEGKVVVAGYPRLEVLRALRAEAERARKARPRRADRVVVVLSWGVDPDALAAMPRHERITYLLHPASGKSLKAVLDERSDMVLSSPEIAAGLLAEAALVLGDFSSMTLEACALGIPTAVFIAREMYRSNCDLLPPFFVRGGPGYGRVVHTDVSLPFESILDADGLKRVLAATAGGRAPLKAIKDEGTVLLGDTIPSALLPPKGDPVAAVLDAAALTVRRLAVERPVKAPVRSRIGLIRFVAGVYSQVLGRRADMAGLRNYVNRGATVGQSSMPWAFTTVRTFINSAEARARFEKAPPDWPVVRVPRSRSSRTASG